MRRAWLIPGWLSIGWLGLRWLFLGWLVLLGGFGAAAERPLQPRAYGDNLQGRPVFRLIAPDRVAKTQAIVLFFLATDCPISKRYTPEILRLEKEFEARGVVFRLVYPNATETTAGVLAHLSAFGLTGPGSGGSGLTNSGLAAQVLVHPGAGLLALAPARITPEAALLVPSTAAGSTFQTVYLGRIDDRYLDIGRERPRATRHDLEDGIHAVLQGKRVEAPGGPPVGCGIVSEAAMQSGRGRQ